MHEAARLGERMTVRLAAAQALQAAAAARSFARVEVPHWLLPPSPVKGGGDEDDADAAAESAEASMERMRLEHVRDREALAEALQNEEKIRKSGEKAELEAAMAELEQMRTTLEAWPSSGRALECASSVEAAVEERLRQEENARRLKVQEALKAALAVAQAAQAEEKRVFEAKLERERAAAERQASTLRMLLAGGALGSVAIAATSDADPGSAPRQRHVWGPQPAERHVVSS